MSVSVFVARATHICMRVMWHSLWLKAPGPASSSSDSSRLLFLLFQFVCFFLYTHTHIGICSTEQGYLESFVFILLFSLTLD